MLKINDCLFLVIAGLPRNRCPEPGDLFAPVPALRVFQDRCLVFVNDLAVRTTWAAANNLCMSFDGKLARVDSKALEG